MKQGEVWLINLNPTIGAEIKKTRPAIIVNDDALGKLPLKVVVPLTEWKDSYDVAPWMIKIGQDSSSGLVKDSTADCFQIRSVSQERFVKRLGSISLLNMEEIRFGLSKVLSIEN